MITFSEIKQSSIARVAGVCVDSPEFAQMVNDATRKLMRRGDWVGTVTPVWLCVRRGCLVMPRYVQSIRKFNLCERRLTVGNLWYQFLQHNDWHTGFWGGRWQYGHTHPGAVAAQGQTPTYSDIVADGRTVRAYITTLADIGKSMTIFGIDNGNQPLRTDNGDGTWSDGWTIALSHPFETFTAPNANPTNYVRRIDRVVKDVTQGQVFLYAYDAVNDVLEDLAVYDPGETSPTYSKYHLSMVGSCHGSIGTSCCATVHSVVALVKLRFVPVAFDTDLCLIENIDSLKDMVQSIKLREAGDIQGSTAFELAAVRESNRELEDNYPDDTFSVRNNIFGGHSYRNQAF